MIGNTCSPSRRHSCAAETTPTRPPRRAVCRSDWNIPILSILMPLAPDWVTLISPRWVSVISRTLRYSTPHQGIQPPTCCSSHFFCIFFLLCRAAPPRSTAHISRAQPRRRPKKPTVSLILGKHEKPTHDLGRAGGEPLDLAVLDEELGEVLETRVSQVPVRGRGRGQGDANGCDS